MSRFKYAVGRLVGRFIAVQTLRVKMLHRRRFDRTGGFVLASSHISHLEPALLTTLLPRQIDWMARIEFYRNRIMAAVLRAHDAFPVNRGGVPVKAIRTAIERVRAGRIVGIFPEGGVVRGEQSVMRGGSIKRGACLVAQRAGVPIVPVVLIGTDRLRYVRTWLPFRWGKIYVIFGRPIEPPDPSLPRRAARFEMAERLAAEMRAIHLELCQVYGLDPVHIVGSSVPMR